MPLIRAWSTHGTIAVARASGFLLVTLLSAGAARADVQSIDGVDRPIVRINVQQGNVTVRTWDRQSVHIDADPSLQIIRRTAGQTGTPYSLPIPYVQQNSRDGVAELPAESFVVTLPPGPHEAIIIRDAPGVKGLGPTPVTVTVPSDSAFVFARTGNGTLDVRDYRSGTFVGFVGRGRMLLTDLGGTAFAQTARGPMIVNDSDFDRFRGRSLFGNVTFERCNVRQIETTAIFGTIVYDRGTFEPGLARFEAQRGNIAIGADGPVQFGGHAAADGRVYTSFAHSARIDGHDGDQNASVGNGGPVVTAMTQGGNVFFYDGSLRTRQQLAPQWQAPLGALQRPGVDLHRDGGLPTNAPTVLRDRIPDYRESPPQPQRRYAPRRGAYRMRRNELMRRYRFDR